MKQLWAPWRMDYIKDIRKNEKKACIFCTHPKKKNQMQFLVLAQTPLSFVIMNKYPYSSGHLLVVPKRHVSEFTALNSEEGLDLFLTQQKTIEILRKVLKPQGINIGMNVGKAAGAGIDAHLHTHIVPRWFGDTNFMAVTAHSRVIPEGLLKTYQKLQPHFTSSPRRLGSV